MILLKAKHARVFFMTKILNNLNLCIDCPVMECKTYYLKKDIWKGYCRKHHKSVSGNQSCNYSLQDNDEQSSLFGNMDSIN